jgi:mRNA-degrading endonuclease toxin of MazEF toxin-antitoxin module
VAQFDVFENPNVKARKSTPLIVVLQHEASTEASTVIAAPLARKVDVPANDRIVVPVEIDGQRFVILFRPMAAISRRLLTKPIANLEDQLLDKLPRAIDYLFLGM